MIANIDNKLRAYCGLVLAGTVFVCVNIFSSEALNGVRVDLTERSLFTISDSTKTVIASIDEPILLRLFFSKGVGEVNPDLATHFDRVHGLLKQYVALSDGKIRLELHQPSPYSTDEDRALAYGLRGVATSAAGDPGYFGLAGLNSTDDQAVIPFFALERESFLEFDLTKVVYTLVNPVKKVVGVISTLPVHGRHAPPYGTTPRWPIMGQLDPLFDIRALNAEVRNIPPDVDLLMLVQPTRLTKATLYAIEQFVMRGGRALIFVDPYAEAQSITARSGRELGRDNINLLLGNWGVAMVPDKVAADIDAARRINMPIDGRLQVLDYVVWLSLEPKHFNRRDIVTAEMSRINVATPGILEPTRLPKTEVTPLMTTGNKTMRIDVAQVAKPDPDAIGMFRDFKSANESHMIAARLTGDVKSAFADGPPPNASRALSTRHLARSEKPIDVIVVADADMLHEKFWADIRIEGDQQVPTPFANNADFVVNALDTLAGGEELVGLRARRESSRPFTYVDNIRREAERRYRSKERALIDRINNTQIEVDALVARESAAADADVLSSTERSRIDQLRREIVTMRQELRQVQRALREDIERLDATLKFLNIGAIPIALAILSLLIIGIGRYRRRLAV
ncbi:MAG: Gldg family protein [Pseudomonadota bacterium]|nr:Gldg family protein [Pseudomonadota bacterium]